MKVPASLLKDNDDIPVAVVIMLYLVFLVLFSGLFALFIAVPGWVLLSILGLGLGFGQVWAAVTLIFMVSALWAGGS